MNFNPMPMAESAARAAAHASILANGGSIDEAKAGASNLAVAPAAPYVFQEADNYESIGDSCGVANHLIRRANYPSNIHVNISCDYLRIRNNRLELVYYRVKTPMPFKRVQTNIIDLYLDVIKLQTPEATKKFLENIHLLDTPCNNAKEKFGIEPITPENLKSFMDESGVLKPFVCFIEF